MRRFSTLERHLLHDSIGITLKLQYHLKTVYIRLQAAFLAASISNPEEKFECHVDWSHLIECNLQVTRA